MRRNKWRGTILFAVILVVMGATIGLKLYGVGQAVSTTATASIASTPASPSPSATGSGPASTPAPAPPASASPSASAASATRVITGSVVNTRYGPIQVQLTVQGSKITAVQELQSPSDDGRSVSINQQAGPILAQEVMSSQSANIDTVSGATYTSDGYKQSVQSAIDQR